jgi:plasmid stabilization system protein ParE
LKPVVFSSLARQEVDAAAAWFEAKQDGLGQRFYDRVQEAVEKIERTPEGFQLVYRNLRRVHLRQFKDYALWFRVLPDDSVVVACLSGRMNPVLAKERALGVVPMPKPPEPS